jgi:transposase
LSDARWALIEPTLTAWRAARAGLGINPPQHGLRTLMNAILYVDRTGIPWSYLPHDFPPGQTVYGYFAAWERDGIFAQPGGLLRHLVRQSTGPAEEPGACVLDSQSVKTATTVPRTSQGADAAKKIVGRKRHIMTDTRGLSLVLLVTAASVQDTVSGVRWLDRAAAGHRRVTKAWVDGGYKNTLVEHGAELGIAVEVVHRPPRARGFPLLPRRWPVERTLGWIRGYRRLVRDYEALPRRSEAMTRLAMIDIMSRRLTGESTPAWRGT